MRGYVDAKSLEIAETTAVKLRQLMVGKKFQYLAEGELRQFH
jgi:hypothetical protein